MNSGGHCEVLRVRRGGVLGRHRHPSPVHGFVLKGRWRYLEHSWVADEGSYVFETPGEVHTLTVDDDDEMQTFFYVGGPTLYVDDERPGRPSSRTTSSSSSWPASTTRRSAWAPTS